MYSLNELAIAHANSARKLLEPNAEFLNGEKAAIPVFVNLLIQSLEISLKAFATEAGLYTTQKLRHKNFKNGHGICEIAKAINDKLDSDCIVDMLLPLRGTAKSNAIIKEMLFGDRFAPTRTSYCKRNLTYADFEIGELQVIEGAKDWVASVLIFAQKVEQWAVLNKHG